MEQESQATASPRYRPGTRNLAIITFELDRDEIIREMEQEQGVQFTRTAATTYEELPSISLGPGAYLAFVSDYSGMQLMYWFRNGLQPERIFAPFDTIDLFTESHFDGGNRAVGRTRVKHHGQLDDFYLGR